MSLLSSLFPLIHPPDGFFHVYGPRNCRWQIVPRSEVGDRHHHLGARRSRLHRSTEDFTGWNHKTADLTYSTNILLYLKDEREMTWLIYVNIHAKILVAGVCKSGTLALRLLEKEICDAVMPLLDGFSEARAIGRTGIHNDRWLAPRLKGFTQCGLLVGNQLFVTMIARHLACGLTRGWKLEDIITDDPSSIFGWTCNFRSRHVGFP